MGLYINLCRINKFKMKLIIGKNSRIVKSLNLKKKFFKIISHTELGQVNFKKYTEIYLFSWAKKNNNSTN